MQSLVHLAVEKQHFSHCLADWTVQQKEKYFLMEKILLKKGLAYHRRNHVSFIFQSYNLIDYLTPKENVELTSKLPPIPILEKMGLTKEEGKRKCATTFWRTATACRRLLVHWQQKHLFILADEPTGNLDEDTAMAIMDILERKRTSDEQMCCNCYSFK